MTGDDERTFLHQFLAGRDVACPQCDYNLRDLQGNTCPECGEKLAMRLGLVEPRQAAALAGLIGLSAGAGLNGLLLIYFILIYFRDFHPDNTGKFFLVNGGGLFVLGLLIFIWLRSWRWLRGLPSATRWTLAAMCWVATLGDLVIFTFSIR